MNNNESYFPDSRELRKRILGCLYGGALGDALGYEVEFESLSSIRSRFGEGGIRRLVPIDGKARFSDDTQMTLFSAEGLVLGLSGADTSAYTDITDSVYQAYLCWLETQGYRASSRWDAVSWLKAVPEMNHPRAPGNTCLSALHSGRMGTITEPINHSKGCGGVMRTAPMGFIHSKHIRRSPYVSSLEAGAKAAAITHGHPLGWIPAGMLSDIVDRCLYQRYDSLRELISDSLTATVGMFAGYDEITSFKALIERAIALACEPIRAENDASEADAQRIRMLGEGWVGDEALAIAVYAALRYEHEFLNALIASVNHSGDSDSTGAIAGNILGAYLGVDEIPADWSDQLEIKEEIDRLADDIIRVIETG